MKRRYNKSSRDLFCYGCAWSNKDVGFPGRPGTAHLFLPCLMCMRNPDVQERVQYGEELEATEWPDGTSPVGLPMDCYISADMLDQTESWTHVEVERATKSQLRKDVTAIAKEYGVNLPEHEV